jgi:hypothetical protein
MVEAPGYILKKTNDISITVCDRLNINSVFYRFIYYKSNSENFITVSCINIQGLKIREFRIQSVVGKDPVELEKYLKKNSLFLKKI